MTIEELARELELACCEVKEDKNKMPYRFTDWDKLATHVHKLIIKGKIEVYQEFVSSSKEDKDSNYAKQRIAELEKELKEQEG